MRVTLRVVNFSFTPSKFPPTTRCHKNVADVVLCVFLEYIPDRTHANSAISVSRLVGGNEI